jgi:hypothetical protein
MEIDQLRKELDEIDQLRKETEKKFENIRIFAENIVLAGIKANVDLFHVSENEGYYDYTYDLTEDEINDVIIDHTGAVCIMIRNKETVDLETTILDKFPVEIPLEVFCDPNFLKALLEHGKVISEEYNEEELAELEEEDQIDLLQLSKLYPYFKYTIKS